MAGKNLWILAEERPKREVIAQILHKFAKDNEIACFIDTIRILPVLNEQRRFTFLYEVIGFCSNKINKVFLDRRMGKDDRAGISSVIFFIIEKGALKWMQRS